MYLMAPYIVVSFGTSDKFTLRAFGVNSSTENRPPDVKYVFAGKVAYNPIGEVVYRQLAGYPTFSGNVDVIALCATRNNMLQLRNLSSIFLKKMDFKSAVI